MLPIAPSKSTRTSGGCLRRCGRGSPSGSPLSSRGYFRHSANLFNRVAEGFSQYTCFPSFIAAMQTTRERDRDSNQHGIDSSPSPTSREVDVADAAFVVVRFCFGRCH